MQTLQDWVLRACVLLFLVSLAMIPIIFVWLCVKGSQAARQAPASPLVGDSETGQAPESSAGKSESKNPPSALSAERS